MYMTTPDMDESMVDKKTDNKFWVRMKWGDHCISPPYSCKNKNLTPIGIDLDNSGAVEAIRGEFVIDITGNHFPETLDEWFAPTEGILIDTTVGLENGINGEHLFGDMGGTYDDGFEKLAEHDDNEDGFINGQELEGLAIWIHANSNAQLDDGELSSLADHGIINLNTKHKFLKSFVTLEDGSILLMQDLFFSEEEQTTMA